MDWKAIDNAEKTDRLSAVIPPQPFPINRGEEEWGVRNLTSEEMIQKDLGRHEIQTSHGTAIQFFVRAVKTDLQFSHLVAIMPKTKTTAAKTPMIAEYRSAVMWFTNTMDARSPSFR